jgi:predicted RNA-binding Zn-ribbon protein involved in translation (DUF1610 family)
MMRLKEEKRLKEGNRKPRCTSCKLVMPVRQKKYVFQTVVTGQLQINIERCAAAA